MVKSLNNAFSWLQWLTFVKFLGGRVQTIILAVVYSWGNTAMRTLYFTKKVAHFLSFNYAYSSAGGLLPS